MTTEQLQEQCELGQSALMRMDYLEAERILAAAERVAFDLGEWDTLARLYMPLQETRRQRRQRCGEGVVHLGVRAGGPGEEVEAESVLRRFPAGQLLIAGWMSIKPAAAIRRLAQERGLYVETLLGAVYPTPAGRIVVIAPFVECEMPRIAPDSPAALRAMLPTGCLIFASGDLPQQAQPGSAATYAQVMDLWERLHRPFLARADGAAAGVARIQGYRRTIEADYACELAHQRLAEEARTLARKSLVQA